MGDGAAEEPDRRRHGQQRGDRAGARRLTEDRDPVGVATEENALMLSRTHCSAAT